MTRNEKSLQALFSDNVNDYPHKDYIRKQLNEADKELDKLEDLYDTAEYFAKEDDMVGVNHASRDMKEDTYALKRKNLETKSMLRDSYTRSSRRPIKSDVIIKFEYKDKKHGNPNAKYTQTAIYPSVNEFKKIMDKNNTEFKIIRVIPLK